MVPRGEVTLVVVLIGIRMNLISPDFYAVLLFVVAISMLLTPPVLAMLFRSQLEPVKKAAAHA
jgi:Kef-type K+ transport system membrane component KefB